MRENKFCGSFTVEATFILPMVLYITISMIYMAMTFRDQCMIQAYSDQMVHQLCMIKQQNTVVSLSQGEDKGVLEYLQQNLSILPKTVSKEEAKRFEDIFRENVLSQCYVVDEIEMSTITSAYTVKIIVRGYLHIPLPFVRALIRKKNIYVASTCKQYDPVTSVRIGDFIYRTASNTKLYDTMSKKIQDMNDLWE